MTKTFSTLRVALVAVAAIVLLALTPATALAKHGPIIGGVQPTPPGCGAC